MQFGQRAVLLGNQRFKLSETLGFHARKLTGCFGSVAPLIEKKATGRVGELYDLLTIALKNPFSAQTILDQIGAQRSGRDCRIRGASDDGSELIELVRDEVVVKNLNETLSREGGTIRFTRMVGPKKSVRGLTYNAVSRLGGQSIEFGFRRASGGIPRN